MHPRQNVSIYFPHSCLFAALLFLLFIFLIAFLFIQAIGSGFMRLGFDRYQVFLLLLGSFLGSAVNIPVKTYRISRPRTIEFPTLFGIRYRIPVSPEAQRSVLAVNVGGCIIPVFVSLFLLFNNLLDIWLLVALSVTVCAFIVHKASRVVPGLGVTLPFFYPVIVSVLLALLLAPVGRAAPIAYITGALGTLIGADLMNIDRIKNLGAPVASIGGAGTWDGIFLSSLIASMLIPW